MITMDFNENYDDPMMKKLPLEKRFQVIQECEIPMGCVGHRLVALDIGNVRLSIYFCTISFILADLVALYLPIHLFIVMK